jgi:nucleotide-binding universal stress UspA family protein
MKTKRNGSGCGLCQEQRGISTARMVREKGGAVNEGPPLRKLKTILVPIDFSEASLKALRYAVPFAEQFGAILCLVHVLEQPSFVNDLPNVVLVRREEEQMRDAHRELLTLAQKEIEELVPIKPQVRAGRPFHEIVEVAKQLKAELIIIATHGHTGLKRALLGSTTELVVRHAPCPVLVVRHKVHDFV